VGPPTARHVERRFELEPLGDLELKGKGAPLTAFRVAGERALPSAPTRRSPLVGREIDLAELGEACATLAEGPGVILAVVGEAWKAGRLDVAPTIRIGEDAPNTITEVEPRTDTWYVCLRADVSPFTHVLVRRAFSHALDRARIAAVAGSDEPALLASFIPHAMPGHSHDLAAAYDLGLARRLLSAAGHPGGRGLPELSFVVLDDPYWLGSRPISPSSGRGSGRG
jgi:ABC-type transport system substrate-binding protein